MSKKSSKSSTNVNTKQCSFEIEWNLSRTEIDQLNKLQKHQLIVSTLYKTCIFDSNWRLSLSYESGDHLIVYLILENASNPIYFYYESLVWLNVNNFEPDLIFEQGYMSWIGPTWRITINDKICVDDDDIEGLQNSLQIKVEITVKPAEDEKLVITSFFNQKLTMMESLAKLFDSGLFSDVTFVVNDVKIPAHRNILAARSEYFNVMFCKTFKEAETKEINISEADPEIFRAMLKYVQANIFPEKFDSASTEQLLTLADRYGLEDLMKDCEKQLIKRLTLENYDVILELSEAHSRKTLKKSAIDFIKDNYQEVIEDQKWEDLKHTNPTLVYEISEAINLFFVSQNIRASSPESYSDYYEYSYQI